MKYEKKKLVCKTNKMTTKQKKERWPDTQHESHKSVRFSDASTFDFICDDCGATDNVTGGWGLLRKPCAGVAKADLTDISETGKGITMKESRERMLKQLDGSFKRLA
jgi:hypothetical protein